jgi:hypothetical protein
LENVKQNIFLEKRWQVAHLKEVKNRAGNRYSPKLNVSLPIAEIFDGISRTENFYIEVRRHYGTLNREFRRVSSKYENKEVQKLYKILELEISNLSNILKDIKEYNTRVIPWKKINHLSEKANTTCSKFSEKLRNEKEKTEQRNTRDKDDKQGYHPSVLEKIGYEIHYLYEIQKELRFFEEFSLNTKAKLSNTPFLLLMGVAGTGKTHLLCDVIENRLTHREPLPTVLVFGELFTASEEPFEQIIQQLDIKLSKEQFLQLLNEAGKKSSCRALLIIDALNETSQSNFWKKNLNKVIIEIKKYPDIALSISMRTGFEDEVLTKKQRKFFIYEEHKGFQFREWEAVSKFFKEFRLPMPEIPLLTPEFQHPLFLLLFCKAFQDRTKKNKGKNQRQIFRGHEGATYIFEAFIDSVSKHISKQFCISNDKNKNIWDLVIEKIAEEMVIQGGDRISESKVSVIIKNAFPLIDYNHFIKELDRNLLLIRVPRYSIKKESYDGFDFRFPFQKFSDHLISRYLFKKYEKEFGITKKNIITAKKFFSRRRKLGKFLSKSWNRGIIEALSVQCPEQLKGIEFIEIAPYLKKERSLFQTSQEAFIESLIWRNPKAISQSTTVKISNFINKKMLKLILEEPYYCGLVSQILNALISLAPIMDHPLNADFFHKHLSTLSMPVRDAWWSTFLHYQYNNKEAVDRLIEWGWSDQEKTHINDESIRLCSVILVWFLTTPNRFVRDKSTKALVSLLTGRLNVMLALLQQFKDVNDPYVSERLYAVAYGCSLRSKNKNEELKNLAQWVYNNVFKNGNPPVHILLRDYARGVIEVALKQNLSLQINKNKIRPPYNSKWFNRIPSEKFLRNKYYPKEFTNDKIKDHGFLDIWSSVMYNYGPLGDFGNYVLNHAVSHWSGRRLNGKEINRKVLLEEFINGLTRPQKELYEKATNPFFGVDIKNIIFSIKYVSQDKEIFHEEKIEQYEKKQKNDMEKVIDAFENSLSIEKKKLFEKEIKPYLDDSGKIKDPLERFNTSLAQRWVFQRVVKLGWKPKLHGEFDNHMNSYRYPGRSENKPERIGKKYQWIALHELLAIISDNFEFKEESWSNKIGKYEGPWQLSIRDVDPSCILKDFPKEKSPDVPYFNKNDVKCQYNAWSKIISDSKWLKKTQDIPYPKKFIELTDDQGYKWIALKRFIEWQDETPPEQEKYDLPTRTLWYIIKSYLIRNRDRDKVFQWARKQHFIRNLMPESHEIFNVFLGEYPWASSFLYHNTPYYHHDGWADRDKKIPAKILVTDDKYSSSSLKTDCSNNEQINVNLPTKLIVDEMKLTQIYTDGRFFNRKGEIVAFDPGIFDNNMSGQILIRKDRLCSFLIRKDYALIWTLIGEKNMMGSFFSFILTPI